MSVQRMPVVKVVHLASSSELGGAELVILDILAGLREARPTWQLGLIVPAPGPLRDRALALGVTVAVLDWGTGIARLGDVLLRRWQLLAVALRLVRQIPAIGAYVIRLRRILRAMNPSLIHAHGLKMHVLARVSRPLRVPLVLHLHDYIGRRPLASRLVRLGRGGAVVGAAISRSIAADADRVFRGSIPIHVTYNGIDAGHWSASGPTLDLDTIAGMAPPPGGTVRVALVATMARWKGHAVFLHAMAQLRERAIRGYVIGGSIYRTDHSQQNLAELKALAERLGVTETVGFTGYVDDPVAAMRALDIVVHASTLPEPFGRVIAEGMATERAVISTAIGGAAELFEPGRSGVAVPPGDAAALAEAIVRLARDGDARRRMGRHARDRVLHSFNRPAMIKSILDVYGSITDVTSTSQ